MRIVHIVRQYHPGVGGLENFVRALAHAQRAAGYECDIITLDQIFHPAQRGLPARDVVDGAPVKRAPMAGTRRFFVPFINAADLATYDVIHVHGVDGMFERVARHRRRPGQVLVATTHGAFFHTKWLAPVKRAYFRAITTQICRRFDAIIANSAADHALMAPHHPHVVLIPNGVAPLGDFIADGGDLLYLGRLSTHKRVALLIDAMAQDALRARDVRLHIVGPDWDVTAAELDARVRLHGLGARVTLHGQASPEALADIARRCACFVSASAYEGFGMSMVEAMGVGLIPVVQNNASFEELASRAGLGALTDFADAGDAARAISAVLDEITSATRARAIAFAKRLSWESHAARTLELYCDLAELNNARSPQELAAAL